MGLVIRELGEGLRTAQGREAVGQPTRGLVPEGQSVDPRAACSRATGRTRRVVSTVNSHLSRVGGKRRIVWPDRGSF